VPDLDAGDVGDGVEGAGRSLEGDAEVPAALATLRRRRGEGRGTEREEQRVNFHPPGP